MGISDDIRPQRVHHSHHDGDFDNHEENKPNRNEETEKSKEPSDTEKIKSFRVPNPALEDQFFNEKKSDHNNFHPKQQENNPEPKKSKAKIVWILIGILILAAAAYESPYSKSFFHKKTDSSTPKTSSGDPSYSGEVITQDYVTGNETTPSPTPSTSPTPSASPSPSASTAPTVTPTTTPAASASTNKSAIALRVLNGNGITGSADQVKKTLIAAGFTVSSVTNAKSFAYVKTYVYYHGGKEAEANLVNAALTSRETIVQQSDTVTGTTYDVVVVVGKK